MGVLEEDGMTFVGIDISKARLDVAAWPSGEVCSFEHSPGGLEQLMVWLNTLDLELAVLEATGGFEHDVLAALSEAGLPVTLVNPLQVRDYLGPTAPPLGAGRFARASGKLAKTDTLTLARFAVLDKAARLGAKTAPIGTVASLPYLFSLL